MDIFRKEALNANKARDIIWNTHKRLKNIRIKSDDEYLKILIDEVNKYFAYIESSKINLKDLPKNGDGPSSTKHNDILKSVLDWIDTSRTRHKNAESLITKAINYLSDERIGMTESSSKLHSKIKT
jgi:hypothetical protein